MVLSMAQLVPVAEIISEQPPTATAAGPATMLLVAVEDPQVGRQRRHRVHWHHNISFDLESHCTFWDLQLLLSSHLDSGLCSSRAG